jgi:maltose O-acetyltransferase
VYQPARLEVPSRGARALSRLVLRGLNWIQRFYWAQTYAELREHYEIDPEFIFNGPSISLYGDGQIVAGPGSYIGRYSTVYAAPGATVTIGAHCSISHNVRIYSGTLHADEDRRLGKAPERTGPVTIGDHAWIGVNVFVGPGVTIGENAVVGANSVVTEAIPADVVAGGVPARVLYVKSHARGGREGPA